MKRKPRTINVCEEVTVDVDVNIEDYIGEFFAIMSNEELMEEVDQRGLSSYFKQKSISYLQNCTYSDFKRFMCDVVGVGYHTNNDVIIEKLKEMM